MNIGGALVALVADASYGLPLLIALGITVGVAWWSRRRTSELPLLLPTEAPEYWRIQIDSRAYFTLQQGRYLVAVDG
ncbi:MAG: hypothetical protein ACREDE_08495, partial [Thermoplasmata archaeon]